MEQAILNYSIVVFAYNEEKRIGECLASIARQSNGSASSVFVLANGCRDRTVSVALEFKDEIRGLSVVEIPYASKTNAWNIFVQHIAPPEMPAIFFDGDVRVADNGIECLLNVLAENPSAYCASGLPNNGRPREWLRNRLITRHAIIGCLYACSAKFISRCRELNLRIPVGTIPDDYTLQLIAKANLTGTAPIEKLRVIPCLEGGFDFDSLSLLDWRDYMSYYKRRVSYSKAHYHSNCIEKVASEVGYGNLPVCIDEILEQAKSELVLKWRGLNTLFDFTALSQLRRRQRKVVQLDETEQFEIR